MFELALFDFDGVLVDSLSVYERSVTECLRQIGAAFIQTREDFLALFDDNFYEALAAKGVNLISFAQVADPILHAIDVTQIIPIAAVCEAAAQAPAQRVIVSSNSAQAIHAVFAHWGIAAFYSDILGSELRYSKKDKIAQAMTRLGVRASGTIYIGDTVGDIKEAHAAGVPVAAVSWGWHSKKRLAAAAPDFLIDTPSELLELLQRYPA